MAARDKTGTLVETGLLSTETSARGGENALESDLRVGGALSDDELIAAVRQAEPFVRRNAVRECAGRKNGATLR